ncbi:DNA adenine methylase [Sphingomonas sp. MAHUQ-71]|uniref:site-specific DNA-methyltransferase (adenine-specific) n=1 Tax=Sphingomonas oryzagri TaxID=3042314 RepID=A0ABT6N7W3_9SPHN|nr:DNA adenine methylase [Sphingomonas oryzagri]MDH7641180.1 DNA adenine methylase [Sphingomonas oryzagri]
MNFPHFYTIRPSAPIAGYIGGKRNLARRLTAIIDEIPCDTYAEPFVGMGGIFLRRSRRPKAEVINDVSADVANLFRVLREHGPEFAAYLQRWWITSRAEFDRLRAIDPIRAGLTDFNRAARFLYLQRLAFGGKVKGRTFGVDVAGPARFNASKLDAMIADLHRRLAGVVIEQLGYADFIRRYDRPGTLFYLDPPYWGCEDDYGPDVFGRADFAQLAEQLAGIAGRFILSINDRPEVRETFARFHIAPIVTTYTVGAEARPAGELIISNFPIG